ncbi:MAG: transposase [Acidobacteriia bacterium]|nr:transposase [Terriglobia bacterium]
MSRLRRWFVADKFFFVTCNVLPTRTVFTEPEFVILAKVFDRVRERRGFLLTGYAFMPDHWHGILFPAPGDSLPRLMGALKIASNRDINRSRHARGEFWQLRYFDHAIRTVKEYQDTLRYIHFNPVTKGLVRRPDDWAWSSFHSYGGPGPIRLRVDLVDLPFDETTRL